jgi:hypothetical protein
MLPGWPTDLAGLVVVSIAAARQAWAGLVASAAGED